SSRTRWHGSARCSTGPASTATPPVIRTAGTPSDCDAARSSPWPGSTRRLCAPATSEWPRRSSATRASPRDGSASRPPPSPAPACCGSPRRRSAMSEASLAAPGRGPLTRTSFRLPFLLIGGLGMLAGLDAALALLGLPHVLVGARLADVHGPLMVLGFVGTVITLERSVALGRGWGYLAPALVGLGVLATVSVLPFAAGAGLILAGHVAGLLVYRSLHARQPSAAVAVQVLGSLMAVAAATLWLAGVAVPALIAWLVGYLVLTILGERIELARIGM